MAYRLSFNPAMSREYEGLTKKLANGKIVWDDKINLIESRLIEPLLNKKPTVYFVDSMSDLFHKEIPFEFIQKIFLIMALCPQHTFQVLTKRPDIMLQYYEEYENGLGDDFEDLASPYFDYMHGNDQQLLPHLKKAGWLWDKSYDHDGSKDSTLIFEQYDPLPNVWVGVSVENQKALEDRFEDLIKTPAAVHFLSCEPLLGPLQLPADSNDGSGYIDWVIVGGESGPGARPMHPEWVRSLRNQCKDAGTAFFFKQWGEWRPPLASEEYDTSKGNSGYPPAFLLATNGTVHCFKNTAGDNSLPIVRVGKKKAGRDLDGLEYNEMPINQSK
jgi:protein gp37